MTGPAQEHRCPMRLLLLVLLLCGAAWASDEVDYSAPYVTLEDGKLVTKYPAKQHTNAASGAAAGTGAANAGAGGGPDGSAPSANGTATAPVVTGQPKVLIAVVAAVAALAAAAVLFARRRNRSRPL